MTDETPPTDGLDAAIKEDDGHTVTVKGNKYRLAEKLTVGATYGISKSQKDEDLAGLIDAAAKLVHEDEREGFLDAVLADEKLDMEEFSNIFKDALEKVTGRPLEQ